MDHRWRLDEHNPFEDTFEEALLNDASAPLVTDCILQTLVRLLDDPTAGNLIHVGGQTFHVVTTPARRDMTVPALVLVYRLDSKNRLIQPVFVGRSAQIHSIDKELSTLEPSEADHISEREILYPIDPTSIPKKKIEDAVLRAVRRAKAS
jgi:hypothetical protein